MKARVCGKDVAPINVSWGRSRRELIIDWGPCFKLEWDRHLLSLEYTSHTKTLYRAVLGVVMWVWIKTYVIYTIYNGLQQDQIIPFSGPGDKSGTKWLLEPPEGQQVPPPAFRGHAILSGVGVRPPWAWVPSSLSSPSAAQEEFIFEITV